TGYSQPIQYRKLDAAPLTLRSRLLDLIDGERRRREQNQPARIRAKINSLVDPEVIHALYRASQAGVDIQLCVRGVCCLQPGVPGLSENIRVISIVDRFLEHSRILEFHHGGDDLLFISSADWMPRNLDRRVELLIPVESPGLRARLRQILDITFEDDVKARRMFPDGHYELPRPTGSRRSQERFYQLAVEAARQARRDLYRVFEPQRPRTQTNP
ncbi:MAG: RNA degradosome polyphosphate kinase, partial [Verrucomicrobiae bacterium]|nr:RNA degradosome polyphosphate kinase [Verrucomicrobiae bacterium]